MKTYLVSWEIEIDAENPREAAKQALAIQRDPNSLSTVFEVIELPSDGSFPYVEAVDLEEEP